MPINEPYTGSQARGYFQMMPEKLEFVLEPREQVAIFDWDRFEPKDLSESFKDMEKLEIDWTGFGTGVNDNQIWSNRTFTNNNVYISRSDTTTVTYLPEIE